MGIGPGPQNRFAIQFVDGCFNQTGGGEDIGGYASLALEPNTNAVNLSYYDFNNRDLRYAYKEDSSNIWHTMSIDGSGTIIGSFTSLVVDDSGNRHISYYDADNTGLKYAYGPAGPNDISWQLYSVDGSGTAVGKSTSLAVDNEGNRHISYYDEDNSGLKYAYGPAGTGDISWQLYKVDTSGDVGFYTSLAVDSLGNRHISYYDIDNADLKYAYGPAGTGDISWQLYSVDTTGNAGQFPSLAVDNSGNRHISYYETINDDLKYAYGPAGTADISWQLYSVDTSGFVGSYTSIAINPTTQKPSISYFRNNGLGSNEIKIATQILDTSWKIGVLDGSLNTFQINGNSQLKIDENKDIHLSFYDFEGSLGRLRYAFNPAGQYGDACPIFTTSTFDVSKVENPTTPVTNRRDFSLNSTNPTFQQPFDISFTKVPLCPPE